MTAMQQPANTLQETETWTYTRYLRETAENEYFAVIEGEQIMSPSPNRWHQIALINIASRLREFVKNNQLGSVYIAPFDVYFSDKSFVQPDLIFIAKQHADRITNNGIMGTPDLVVEIISPGSTRIDRITKRQLYATYGVPEYWIVSPNERTIEVLSLKDEGYETFGLYENEEMVTSRLLTGFSIKTNELFDE